MYLSITRKRLVVSGMILCCLCTSGFPQKKRRIAIDEDVGPIRSIEEWDVTVVRSAGRIRRTRRRLSSRGLYDRKGNLTAYTAYTDEGEILYGDRNTYDASGRLTKTQTVHSQFVYLPDKKTYCYDERGNVVEIKGFDSSGRQLGGNLNGYDSAGNLVRDMSYPVGKNMVYNQHVTVHVYDEQGNETKREQYVSHDGGIVPDEFGMGYQRQVFLNDNAGRPRLTGHLKADNTLVRIETVEYDSRGNTVKEIEREPGGRLLRSLRYTYVFDRHGNWVKQIRREWTADGVGSVYAPLERSYRTIRYYRRPYDKRK